MDLTQVYCFYFLFISNHILIYLKLDLGNGYKWSQPYLKIKTGDFVNWKWSAPNLVAGLNYKIEQVEDGTSTKPIGFTSGGATPTGIPLI